VFCDEEFLWISATALRHCLESPVVADFWWIFREWGTYPALVHGPVIEAWSGTLRCIVSSARNWRKPCNIDVACVAGSPEACQALLKAGANVKSQDKDGLTGNGSATVQSRKYSGSTQLYERINKVSMWILRQLYTVYLREASSHIQRSSHWHSILDAVCSIGNSYPSHQLLSWLLISSNNDFFIRISASDSESLPSYMQILWLDFVYLRRKRIHFPKERLSKL
jgi:hypothetical protein